MKSTTFSLVFLFSAFVAACLEVIPLFEAISWLRPEFMLLLVVAHAFKAPSPALLPQAFVLGLVMDVLTGEYLGLNALGFVLAVGLILRGADKHKSRDLLQQSFQVFQLAFIILAIQFWGGVSERAAGDMLTFFAPAIITASLWPVCRLIFRVV